MSKEETRHATQRFQLCYRSSFQTEKSNQLFAVFCFLNIPTAAQKTPAQVPQLTQLRLEQSKSVSLLFDRQ
jgi:hypothetical protein